MSDIVERLRGIYRVQITDGLGKVDGNLEQDNENEFVRQFPSPPVQIEAADEITRLRTALSEAEQRVKNARREAVEEAVAIAKTVSDDLSMAELHPERRIAQRIYKSIRALIPSEPHDAEGRE